MAFCHCCLKETEQDFCRSCSKLLFGVTNFSAKLNYNAPQLAFSEKGFYGTLSTIMWVWVIALLFITFKEANNISFWKSIFFTLVIVIAMFLIVIVLLLAFALDSQIYLFFQELWSEKDFLFK